MKFFHLVAVILALPLLASEVRVVESFDLNRYLGKWHEVARMPNRFEEGCVDVTAEYGLRDDGKITVRNSCQYEDGSRQVADGVARVNGTGKLRVNFVPWLPFAAGDYWVLDIDPEYRLSVVAEPKRKLGWILARTPEISAAERERAIGVLRDAGYDVDTLIFAGQK